MRFTPFAYMAPKLPSGAWSFREDSNASSLVFATPGNLITDLGMSLAWSDVHADISGSGTNLSVLTDDITTDSRVKFADDGYTESTSVSLRDGLRASNDASLRTLGSNFTIECWVNPGTTSLPNRGLFWDYRPLSNANSAIFWDLDAGRTRLAIVVGTAGGSETFVQSAVLTWTNNVWYHMALTRSGSTYRLFRDGTQVVSTTKAGSLNSTSEPKYIFGQSNRDGTTTFVQDYRFYIGVAKYTGTFTPPPSLAVFS